MAELQMRVNPADIIEVITATHALKNMLGRKQKALADTEAKKNKGKRRRKKVRLFFFFVVGVCFQKTLSTVKPGLWLLAGPPSQEGHCHSDSNNRTSDHLRESAWRGQHCAGADLFFFVHAAKGTHTVCVWFAGMFQARGPVCRRRRTS